MRIVIDTNVYVSAVIYHGRPKLLLDQASLSYDLVISDAIFAEVRRIFLNRFHIPPATFESIRLKLWAHAIWVAPQRRLTLCSDPDDNKFLEAAEESQAEYLVFGDKHLLTLKRAGSCRILTVTAMLEILGLR